MPKKTKKSRPRAEYLILYKLPRCSICNQLLLTTCDRSKPSEPVEWMGSLWTKKKPQVINFYPKVEEQSKLCPYCEDRLHPIKIGKES